MKLFIQEFDDKFINNISLIEHPNIVIVNDEISGNLYSIHYRYNFDTYVFVSSLMTNEIYQYILEFHKSKQIILYHDIINNQVIDTIAQFCINVGTLDSNGITKIPTLINDHIFFNMSKQRSKHIPCFIDHAEVLDEDLLSVLYPNKKLHIRLFGSSLIRHPQNIGLLSEKDRAEVLNASESCLMIDDLYLPEALSCGTKILRPKEGKLIEDETSTIVNTETYAQFLIRILQS
jgi:hypothetical protein